MHCFSVSRSSSRSWASPSSAVRMRLLLVMVVTAAMAPRAAMAVATLMIAVAAMVVVTTASIVNMAVAVAAVVRTTAAVSPRNAASRLLRVVATVATTLRPLMRPPRLPQLLPRMAVLGLRSAFVRLPFAAKLQRANQREHSGESKGALIFRLSRVRTCKPDLC